MQRDQEAVDLDASKEPAQVLFELVELHAEPERLLRGDAAKLRLHLFRERVDGSRVALHGLDRLEKLGRHLFAAGAPGGGHRLQRILRGGSLEAQRFDLLGVSCDLFSPERRRRGDGIDRRLHRLCGADVPLRGAFELEQLVPCAVDRLRNERRHVDDEAHCGDERDHAGDGEAERGAHAVEHLD